MSNIVEGLILACGLAAIFAWGQRGLRSGRSTLASGGSARSGLRPSVLALIVGLMAALCFSGEGAVLDWAGIYLRDHLGAPGEYAAAGYLAFSGAMAIGRFLGDWIRRHIDGVTLVRSGCLLAFAGLLIGPLSGNPIAAVVGYALTGLGFSNIVPVLFSAAGAMPRPEAQIAVVSTLGYAGLLAAPPLLGFVAHATTLTGIFYIVAAATIVIAALASACAPASNPMRSNSRA